MDEAGILNEKLPELNRVLNFSIIKLYLLKHHLLSIAEVQELDKTSSRADLTTNLVAMVVQRTRNPAQRMLEVLRDIVRDNEGSEALEDMADQLQRKLESARKAGGALTRSRTPADVHTAVEIHGAHGSPPPQLYTGRHHGPMNYPSSCGDSTGYHSAVSSCLSIPGQHSCCNLYPPASSPNRSGVRLSRCYSDWTISSTLKAPYDSFHGNHFSSTAHLFDDEEKQDSKLLPSVQVSPHHDSTSPAGQLCKCTNTSREMASHCKTGRSWLLHGEATEKDSPRQTKLDSSHKSIDELYYLVEATQQITSAYSTFTVKVANLLSQCNVSSILLWLSCKLSMNAPGCLSIPQTAPVFQAKTVHEVFKEIQSYTSWLDYTLTAALAEELGGEEGKKLVSEYEAKLKPHLEKRVAVFQPDYLTTPYGFKELQVKLDWELAKTDYERVIRFRITLSRLLRTQPSCFILKGLREGCVLLTWLVPEHLCPAMVDSAKANFDLLATQAILAITVMGYTVTAQGGASSPMQGCRGSLPSASNMFTGEIPTPSHAALSPHTDIHELGDTTSSSWSQGDCSFSQEPATKIDSQSSLSLSSSPSPSPTSNSPPLCNDHTPNSSPECYPQSSRCHSQSSDASQEVSILPPPVGINDPSTQNDTVSIKSLENSPKIEHVLPCYSFRDKPSLHTATTTPSPSTNTCSSEATQELVEGNIHSHLTASVSLPSNAYDNEERSLLLNSSWQSEPPEADTQRRVLLQLQKQCTMREEEEEEEEEEKGEREQQALNVVKHVGKAAKLKRFFRLLKNSMSRQPLPEQTEKEQQPLVAPVSSMTAAHNPEQLYRLIAQRRLCADATRPGSLYSQADSAYGSRSGSESNSIRRRSTAALSTLTSNCPSHDDYIRQDSFLSTREGTFTSRQGAAAKMRFPLGTEHKACEKNAREREDSNPLYENLKKQAPPTRKHTECQYPAHATTAPDIANMTKSHGADTLVESSYQADYEDDDDSDLPEQRLMMMTAGCARASRRKPQFLMYTKRGRNARSRKKYSPVNTNPLTNSGTVTEDSQATSSPTKRSMAYQPLCTDEGEMLPLSTCLTRQLSSREGCISGEFNKIIHYLHDLHSSLCQALEEDAISFNGESSDHESQHSDNEEVPSSPTLPIQETEMYLQAAVILQTALSTLSLDLEEMMKLPGEDDRVCQQVQ